MNRSRGVWALVAVLLSCWLSACGGGGGGGGKDEPAFKVTDLNPTDSAAGALTDGDMKSPDGTRFDLYRVSLTQPGRLTARLVSSDFDAYLWVFDGKALEERDLNLWDPHWLADDDDSGGGTDGTDAEISIDLPAGTYVLAVNSLDVETGSYTLVVAVSSPASPPQVGTSYLQYRTYESGTGNRYQAWVQVTRDGAPVDETEVSAVHLLDSVGAPVEAMSTGFYSGEYLSLNCSVDPCSEAGPLAESGFWATYSDLDPGVYGLELINIDPPNFFSVIDYPGQLALPVVASAGLQAQRVGSDLTLNWTNPASEANWTQVERLYVVLLDGAGKDVLYVRLPPTAAQVTISGTLLSRAAALGDGTLAQWEVQTRAYDSNAMNYARGYSAREPIP